MVWCSISNQKIADSYFFGQRNVAEEPYKSFLHYYAFPKLWDYAEDNIFQQNAATQLYAVPARQYFDQKFSDRWMTIAGYVLWDSTPN